jgi:NAD(P)-dependent dehydrogenase (short-subunit alcohol dehydrogenase family)
MRLSGSDVVLVTGGASGLGAATVRAAVEAGAQAVIVDLASSQGADLAAELDGSDSQLPTCETRASHRPRWTRHRSASRVASPAPELLPGAGDRQARRPAAERLSYGG